MCIRDRFGVECAAALAIAFVLWVALGVAQVAAYLAAVKLWLGIGPVADQNVCCNFDDFGRIFAAEIPSRLIGAFL